MSPRLVAAEHVLPGKEGSLYPAVAITLAWICLPAAFLPGMRVGGKGPASRAVALRITGDTETKDHAEA